MDVKKNKMFFLQVKDNEYFNGRELIKNNIDNEGNRIDIHLRLTNPLLDLLFEFFAPTSSKSSSLTLSSSGWSFTLPGVESRSKPAVLLSPL